LIRGYVALLDRERLGFDMLCFIQISLQLHQVEQVMHFRTAIQQLPEVLECHHVTGEYDYLLKIVVRNRQELERLVMEKLTPIPGVARIHTSLVFSEIKASTASCFRRHNLPVRPGGSWHLTRDAQSSSSKIY
jgi:Lrp/AsnC family leucine-responsive transcriptional regulator